MSNNIVSSASALVNDSNYDINNNNIVSIDLTQGFIGVHKSSPDYELDVSGTISCNAMRISGELFNISDIIGLENFENTIIPETSNTYSLGSVNKLWSNTYINDLSVSSITITSNLNPLTNNGGSLGEFNKLWRNAYINNLSGGSIDVSNSLNPLINNSISLGTSNKIWNNAYISNISANTIDASVNINPFFSSGSLGAPSKLWRNAYIQDLSISSIDVSVNLNPLTNNSISLGTTNKLWRNAYINDLSVANISISGNIVPLLNLSGSLGAPNRLWRNAYINDLSISSIDVSINLNPLTNNRISLGTTNKLWRNAYIRDLSVNNAISISGNIVPLRNIGSNLGSLTNRWRTIFVDDLSTNKINGLAYSGGSSTVISSVNNNIIPSVTNTYNLGSSSNYWKNAYITDLGVATGFSVSGNFIFNICGGRITNVSKLTNPSFTNPPNITTTHRIYQELNVDISWSAVNGYYGLAKHAYPSLNPYSTREQAALTWTGTPAAYDNTYWAGTCWSPELGLFAAVTQNSVMTSSDGKTWTVRTIIVGGPGADVFWSSVCWSPELRMFVAVADEPREGTAYKVLTSSDGITWTQRSAVNNYTCWSSVCWSRELGLFVAVAGYSPANGGTGGTNKVMISTNGINWDSISSTDNGNYWASVCWSAELRIFVAVAYFRSSGSSNHIMFSSNGTTWTSRPASNVGNYWSSVCWSPRLGIFVAVAYGPHSGTVAKNYVMTSYDGIDWTGRVSANESNAWSSVCWSPQLELFVAVAGYGTTNKVMTSSDGITWIGSASSNDAKEWGNVCWSPELGIFIAVANGTSANNVMTSSLRGRPPTSYNVFDSCFNRIAENGVWTFLNLNAITLRANGVIVNSDDRLKHNEIIIANGLDVIDQLVPKFYQKTQVMLDASYNGDLTNYAWNYEAGFIAQELLQISDLSFTVGGGDTYKQIINYYEISNNNYEISNNNYEVSNNNYEISNNNYEVSNNNYEVSNNLITQSYYLNYNSVFTYGLAATKKLHEKVKRQETVILNQKSLINSLITRIETLENKP
jgi:hypothetical protein